MNAAPRIAVVHDYLTQQGGAERVVLSMLRAFPQARLVTSCYSPERTFADFRDHDVETMWLNRVPALRADPRRALPLLPRAFSGHLVSDVDVVLCSSSGFAHGIATAAPKVVYCHNPARWLYQPDDYFGRPAARAGAAGPAVRPRLDSSVRTYRSRGDEVPSRGSGGPRDPSVSTFFDI